MWKNSEIFYILAGIQSVFTVWYLGYSCLKKLDFLQCKSRTIIHRDVTFEPELQTYCTDPSKCKTLSLTLSYRGRNNVSHTALDRRNTFTIYASRFQPKEQWVLVETGNHTKCKDTQRYDFGILVRRVAYANNIGHLLPQLLGPIYNTIQDVRSSHHGKSDIALLFPPIHLQKDVKKYREFFSLLGAKLYFVNEIQEKMCFDAVAIPASMDEVPLSFKAIQHYKRLFNVSNITCEPHPQVTIVQRTHTRRIINIDDLVNQTKSFGFDHVRVVTFENKTIAEQMEIVHCSSVFIGIHGAGMSWYHFLQEGAFFVEIAPNGWRMNFYVRQSKDRVRPRLRRFGYHCLAGYSSGKNKKLARKFDCMVSPIPCDCYIYNENLVNMFSIAKRELLQ